MSDATSPITTLLTRWSAGDEEAFPALMRLAYDDLRAIAHRRLMAAGERQTLSTTALVHEAYLRLDGHDGGDWPDRARFYAFTARAMRHILVDHARSRHAEKRGGDALRIPLEEMHGTHAGAGDGTDGADGAADVLDTDRALEQLAERHPRMARIVELRFFGGLTVPETAEALGTSRCAPWSVNGRGPAPTCWRSSLTMGTADELLWTRWLEVDRRLDALLDMGEPARARTLSTLDDAEAELGALLRRLLGHVGATTPRADAAPAALVASRLRPRIRRRARPRTWHDRRSLAVVRQRGRGGMATVYEAERADGAYEQRVALKVLRPDSTRPTSSAASSPSARSSRRSRTRTSRACSTAARPPTAALPGARATWRASRSPPGRARDSDVEQRLTLFLGVAEQCSRAPAARGAPRHQAVERAGRTTTAA